MEYNEYAITLGPATENECYPATAEERYLVHQRIRTERAAETPEPFHAAPFLQSLDLLRREIQKAIYQQPHDAAYVRQYGRQLFEELFKGGILCGLTRAIAHAQAMQDRGLRIRIICPPRLRALPWELMFRTDELPEHHLCLNPALALVRSSETAAPIIATQLPLRILVVASSPRNRSPVKARYEVDLLLSCWEELIRSGQVQVDFIHGTRTLERLLLALKSHPGYHILHFIGHGEELAGQTSLVLEDGAGDSFLVTGMGLWKEFQRAAVPRLVVLNLCKGATGTGALPFASLAEVFLVAGIPAVIAHQWEISDAAAAVFARGLYASLLQGAPVDAAVAQVRQALESTCEWPAPVLFLDSSTGALFLAPVGAKTARPQAAVPLERARQAAQERRWAEAASYAQTTLLLTPGHPEGKELLQQALAEEELEAYLREAGFAEGRREWGAAAFWYGRYLDAHAAGGRPAAERARYDLLRSTALAGVGIRDPWLKWGRLEHV